MSYQRDYQRKLRVAVIGVGSHAYRNLLPAMHYLPMKLEALCDLDESLARRTAEEYRVPVFVNSADMYSTVKLDAVLISADPRQHPRLAIEALRAGLAVWIEKPPGVRAADVDTILAAAADSVCAVGFKKAYMPAVRKARELIDGPDFGRLRSLLAIYPMTMPRHAASVIERGEITNWLLNGCHPLSLMVELGGRVESVQTVVGSGDHAVGSVNLRYASGAVGTLFLAGGSPPGRGVERYELFGENQTVAIEDTVRVAYHRGIPFDYARQTDFTSPGTESGSVVWSAEHRLATLENTGLFVQGIFDELLDFCLAVLDGRGVRTCDLRFARHVMGIYEAALRSSGELVSVE